VVNAAPAWHAVLSIMSEAFSTGDNQRGEELLWSALDAGAPWDVATASVANALSAHRTVRQHGAPAPESHGTPAPA
jgi:hypothetical protein